MSSWIHSRLRWVIVGCAAGFLFVAGGTAYAAFVVNSNADVAADTISGHAPPSGDHSNIITGSVNGTDLAASSVNTGKIVDGTVGNSDLAADSVRSGKILDHTVANADLANNSVDSLKIVDGAVGNADLAPNSVDSSKIQDGTITGSDVLQQSLPAGDINGVHSMDTSGLILVNDPIGGGATNTGLVTAGGLLLNSHCTNAGGGSVTAEVNAVFDFNHQFAVTSDAPGGTTNFGTIDPVQVANFGPTTTSHLGTGKVTVVASFQPVLSGVLTVGTHILGHDCVFSANTLG